MRRFVLTITALAAIATAGCSSGDFFKLAFKRD